MPVLTHWDQIPEVLQHHILVQLLLGRVQQPELLLREGHSHIREGHCLLQQIISAQSYNQCPVEEGQSQEAEMDDGKILRLLWKCVDFPVSLLLSCQHHTLTFLSLPRSAAMEKKGWVRCKFRFWRTSICRLPSPSSVMPVPHTDFPQPQWLPQWFSFLSGNRLTEVPQNLDSLPTHPLHLTGTFTFQVATDCKMDITCVWCYTNIFKK